MKHRFSVAAAKQLTFASCAFTLALCVLAHAKSSPKAAVNRAPAPNTATQGVVVINAQTRNDTPGTAVLLAQDGHALLPIIISDKADADIKATAADLAATLGRITGATFEIKTGDGSSGIVLGTLAQFPAPTLAAALKIYDGYDGKEALAIRSQKNRLLLLGATDLGASHAASRLLEAIGYRQYFPDAAWEVVPHLTRLSFSRDISDRPAILSRDIWFSGGSGTSEAEAAYTAWKRHNFLAESFIANAGHNLNTIIDLNKAAFTAHPEYYAAIKQADGSLKRDPTSYQLELANPAVRKMIVDYALDYFKQNPTADMVSLDPADNALYSQSPESEKLGNFSDAIFGGANEAARALQKAYPGQGKMVGLYSYSAHWDPPSFALEPNVHVEVTSLGQGDYTPLEREKVLGQRAHNLGFYEYYSVWEWTYDRLPGSGTSDIHLLQNRMRDIVGRNGTAVSAQSTSSWGVNGRGYYFAAKLMWNPDLDVDALDKEFYDDMFGPAAPMMKRYFEQFAASSTPLMGGHLLGLSYRDVDAASKAASDRPDVQARIDQIKSYLHYVLLDWQLYHETSTLTADQKQALPNSIMTQFYRMRGHALTSYELARQTWGAGKTPSGKGDRGDGTIPWEDNRPYTHEQIEAEFQDGLHHFAPMIRDVGERITYYKDLVAVQWPTLGTATAPAASLQMYQGPVKYALYSLHGEPLQFETGAGTAWNGINRLSVTDAKGNEIYHKNHLPGGVKTTHNIAVPGPGLYWLDYTDNNSFWNFNAAPGVPATIPTGQTLSYNSAVLQDMFFYIPKGIKNFEYYYAKTNFHPGGPHQVLDPTGKVVKDVATEGDWISVPVAPGMDGKIWRFHNPVQGLFVFNNTPPYFAASPEALLVPREVALKDGLTIRH